MTTPAGRSIWLMPTGRVYDELSVTISQLSNQYSTPSFPPHVTLVEGLTGNERELSSTTEQLASRIRPFEIALSTIDYLDEYFRCLFLRIEESPALLEANRAARMIFHQERDPGFVPHLSLMYGNLDLQTKRQIVQIIGTDFKRTFPVESLHLYSTNGEPKDWRLVQECAVQS